MTGPSPQRGTGPAGASWRRLVLFAMLGPRGHAIFTIIPLTCGILIGIVLAYSDAAWIGLILALVVGLWIAMRMAEWMFVRSIPKTIDESTCPMCGYSIKGIDATRCPECGTDLERLRSWADSRRSE